MRMRMCERANMQITTCMSMRVISVHLRMSVSMMVGVRMSIGVPRAEDVHMDMRTGGRTWPTQTMPIHPRPRDHAHPPTSTHVHPRPRHHARLLMSMRTGT